MREKSVTVESSTIKVNRTRIIILTRDTPEQFVEKINKGIYFMTVFSDDVYVEKHGKIVGTITQTYIASNADKSYGQCKKFKMVASSND